MIRGHVSKAYVFGLIGLWAFFLSSCSSAGSKNIHQLPAGQDISTSQLYDNLAHNTDGLQIAFAIDTDHHVISRFSGQTALRSFLAKQPPIDQFQQLDSSTTDFVSGAWIDGAKGTTNLFLTPSAQTHGKYLIWGYLTDNLPDRSAINYQITASWHCSGCKERIGAAKGTVRLHLVDQRAVVNFASKQLSLQTSLNMTEKNQLRYHPDTKAEILIEGKKITPRHLTLRGGLFGPQAENIGMIFGISTQDRRLSGIVLGNQ